MDGYLSSVATIKRMDLLQAVEQFIQSRAHKTEAKDGKRPQLSTFTRLANWQTFCKPPARKPGIVT